jgi:gliding motility-associated-like protein
MLPFIGFQFSSLYAQNINKVYRGGISTDYFFKVFETSSGFDAFGTTTSFGAGSTDILFVKMDSCGEVLSSFAYGGFNQENFVGAFQKASGNYAIFCKTTSYTDVGSSLEQDILVFEISPDGSIVKSSVIERSNNSARTRERPFTAIASANGGYLIVGHDEGNNSYLDDPSILKLDESLNPEWYKEWTIVNECYGRGITELSSGSILTASMNATFSGGGINILKHTSDGEVIARNLINLENGWRKYIYPKPYGKSNSVVSLYDESYFLVTSNLLSPDSWGILKVDSNANLMWTKQYEVSNTNDKELSFYSIYTDNESIYIAGRTNVNLQPFVMKIDTSGSVKWAKNILSSGSGVNRGMGKIIGSNSEKIYLCGSSSNPASNTGTDGFFTIIDTSDILSNCESSFSIQVEDFFSLSSSMSGSISSRNVFKSWDQPITRTAITSFSAENVCPWEQKDTTICNGDSIEIDGQFFKIAGVYPDHFSDVYGCDSIILRNLIVSNEQSPQVDLGNDTTLCDGDQIILQNKTLSTLDKQWQDGSTNASYDAISPGEYWLMEQNDCGETRDTISIELEPNPIISLGNDTSICTGEQIRLTAQTDGDRVTWNDQSTRTTLDVSQEGTYWAISESSKGCENSDTINVELIDCEEFELHMPNVFTPNGDDLNERFRPIVFQHVDETVLTIYNRWGEKLFETNDIENGWDGNYRGEIVPDGVYFWLLEYREPRGVNPKLIHMNGTVTIIR